MMHLMTATALVHQCISELWVYFSSDREDALLREGVGPRGSGMDTDRSCQVEREGPHNSFTKPCNYIKTSPDKD